MSEQRDSSVLDPRSVIVAVVVLLVGAGIGFGVGYKYGHHTSTKTAVASGPNAKTQQTQKPAAKKPTAAQAAQKREQLLSCLASHGVRYPTPATADLNSPPPGVDKAKFSSAISACFTSVSNSG